MCPGGRPFSAVGGDVGGQPGVPQLAVWASGSVVLELVDSALRGARGWKQKRQHLLLVSPGFVPLPSQTSTLFVCESKSQAEEGEKLLFFLFWNNRDVQYCDYTL